MYLHTRSDGQLFNLDRLRAKTKVRVTLIRDMLFADDGAVTSITEQQLQCLMDRFSQACKDFGLTISLKKTNVLGQDLDISPLITIDSYELDVVHLTLVPPSATTWATTCPGCRNQPAYREGHNNVGPTDNSFLGESQTDVATNIAVNEACIISTLLYGSEAWTIYAKQERKLNSLHMRSLHLILGIIWSERVA